jgi:phosphotransferase system enzyme I (PtsI)
MTCQAAEKAGIIVGMCGELAGDPEMAEILIGLGLHELSMSAGTIPQVKQSVRKVNSQNAKGLANEAVKQLDGDQVRKIAKRS